MHQKCQDDGMRAPIKYKVHKSGCSCSKLRTKLNSGNFQFVEQDTIIDDNDNNTLLDDGLIMHPDAKGIPCIFFWRNSKNVFAEDPRLAERELQNQIDVAAAAAAAAAAAVVVVSSSFKVTCAACLLDDEPNGFACVSSSSEEAIHLVRDWTRKLAAKTPMDQRASDHGDFVLTLPRHLLQKLKMKKKKEQKQKQKKDSRTSVTTTTLEEDEDDDSICTITEQIVAHMTQQNVPIPHEETREGVELKLGHHLDALLQLTASSSKEEDDSSSSYWLLHGYDDSSCTDAAPASVSFELNIPGGKRHLGETCLQAAIRETQEETSLIWDERWIVQEYQNRHRPFEKINRYYMLHPPDPAALAVALEQEEEDNE
jgi:hypothetical protein